MDILTDGRTGYPNHQHHRRRRRRRPSVVQPAYTGFSSWSYLTETATYYTRLVSYAPGQQRCHRLRFNYCNYFLLTPVVLEQFKFLTNRAFSWICGDERARTVTDGPTEQVAVPVRNEFYHAFF